MTTLDPREVWAYLRASPLLWLAVTLVAYQAAYGTESARRTKALVKILNA